MMAHQWHGYAVLAGRWQPLHKGHLWVVERMLAEASDVVLALVNPDPARPPDRAFDRFRQSVNPLSYWERYWMLAQVAGSLAAEERVRILPSWHPRVSVEPERFFLPSTKQLLWYVPLASDEEEQKASDFRNRGLHVHVVHHVPADILRFSAVGIRQQLIRGADGAMDGIPEAAIAACDRIGFDLQAAIRHAYDPAGSRRPLPKIEVAVLPGWYSPPDSGHLERIVAVLENHQVAHLAILVDFDGYDEENWPRGLAVDEQSVMTYWERYEALHQSIVLSGWYQRLTIGPLLRNRTTGTVEYAAFVPDPSVWVVDVHERGGRDLAGRLTQYGEQVQAWQPSRASQEARGAVAASLSAGSGLPSEALAKGSAAFVLSLFLETRCRTSRERFQEARKTGGSMGGMQFYGPVTVQGNVINIEGNSYTLASGDVQGFCSALDALVRSSVPSEQLGKAATRMVQMVETTEVAPDDIRVASADVARAMAGDPRLTGRLRLLASDIAAGASGSLIATAIVEGLRAVVGG